MRFFFLFLLLVLSNLKSTAQNRVQCELINHPSADKHKFAYFLKAGNSKVDMVEIRDGRVSFAYPKQTDSIIKYGIIYFSKYPNQNLANLAKEGYRYDFVLENTNVNIFIDSFHKKTKIDGGLENRIFFRIEELYRKVNSQPCDSKQQVAKNCLLLSDSLFKLIEKYPTTQVLYPYFKSMVEFYYKYDKSQIIKVKELFDRMPCIFKDFKWGKESFSLLYNKNQQSLFSKKMEGIQLADISLINKKGEKTTLYNHKAKVILIDFWATWCRPCLQDKQELYSLQKKYKERNIIIVGIALDKKEETWRFKITKFNTTNNSENIPEYWANCKSVTTANIRKLPTYIIVDAEKREVLKWDLPLEDIESELKNYLE